MMNFTRTPLKINFRLLVSIVLFTVSLSSWGQTVVVISGGATVTCPATPIATWTTPPIGVTFSNWSRGSGVTCVSAGNALSGSAFTSFNGSAAVTANKYYSVTITADATHTFSLSSVLWNTAVSSGTSNFDVFYSNNGSAITSFGTTGSSATTNTFTGTVNVAAGTSLILYLAPSSVISGTTVRWLNNSTISVTASTAGITSAQTGNWSNTATWVGGVVPTPSDNAIIASGHTVTMDNSTYSTRNSGTSTTVNSGGTLATNLTYINNGSTTVNGTFQLNTGGYATGTNFAYGAAGTLNFNSTSSYGVDNTAVFWPTTNGPFNVNVLQGGLTLNSANRTVAGTFATASGVTLTSSTLTLNGTAQINGGGFFNQAPIFGNASTLIYNTTGTFGRGLEWSALGIGTIGTSPGYPNNIQISNTTTFNYNNGTPLAKAINGNLTIDAGSSFYMDYGGSASGGFLTIAGSVINKGNFTLGSASGDDLKIGGDFTNTGTFNGNNRAIFFIRSATGTQLITSPAGITIPYIVIQPSAGTDTVQLATGTNLTISAPNGGIALTYTNATDILDINSNTLTIGTAGVANTINGSGKFKGSTTSNLTLLGTGSIGTLNFTSGSQNLGTLTINRQAAIVGCVMGTPVTINSSLVLTNGLVDLGANTMTLASTCSNTFTAASNSFVIADFTAGGILRKNVTALATTFNFPIGDKTGTLDYSPATINFPSGTLSSAYIGFSVQDFALATDKHPNLDATTNYISRYWSITKTGTAPAYTVTADYLASDVNGTEANCKSNQWNGTTLTWSNTGVTTGTNSLSLTGITAFPTTNHITKGERDTEININQGATNYSTASTYIFASALTGTNNDIVFTIENLGEGNLNLGGATITGNPVYTLLTNYTSTVAGLSNSSFTIRFSPTIAGTFTGSISIPNNDTSGSENPYIINFSGVATIPAPEARLERATLAEIPDGSIANSGYDTVFAGQTIGVSSTAKTYTIRNTGTANLTLSNPTLSGTNSGDFSISAATLLTIAPAGTATFTVIFTPSSSGTRNATVTFLNNDSDEATYNFDISGTGNCAIATNTITPTSGPVGTEVIITATANNLTAATATFNGISATVTQISSTQIKVIVPIGATSGNLTTTNAQGCTSTNAFTVIDNFASTCQGGSKASDLFISEVTDATTGGLSYVEIYNGTRSTVNLSSYRIDFYNNGNLTQNGGTVPFGNVDLLTGYTFTIAVGVSSAPYTTTCSGQNDQFNGSLANLKSGNVGINFYTGGNDHIGLFKSSVLIDSFGIFGSNNWADGLGIGDRGASFRRVNTATLPNTTYSNSDWDITDWTNCVNNDYSDIGIYSFPAGTPPTVTLQPVYSPSCKATSLTVAGAEGFVGGNPLAYQWYGVAPNVATWTALPNSGVYSGATLATLSISNLAGMDGYQFYCQIRENGLSCYKASNPVKIIEAQTLTWNGTWSPIAPSPSLATIEIINANYNTTTNGDLNACSIIVNAGKTLMVTAEKYVSIQNDLTVNSGGNVVVLDKGSLIMIDDSGVVTNNGTTDIHRFTAPFDLYDYTYWSTPIVSTSIATTFPTWRMDHAYYFEPLNFVDIAPADGFDDDGNDWVPATTMAAGKGYIIMGPTNLASPPSLTYPLAVEVVFSGKVNNGVVSTPISLTPDATDPTDDFNLVGNPYPSAISADALIKANISTTGTINKTIEGTLYFWTHKKDISISNPGPDAYNYSQDDYSVYTLAGGIGTSGTIVGTTEDMSNRPLGYIASGQGFFIEAVNAGTLTFNNAMRVGLPVNANSQFYKRPHVKPQIKAKNRLWLNLENSIGMFSQQLVGYFNNTTLGYDNGYDGLLSDAGNYVNFYSFIDDARYKIQGRPAFDKKDQVRLGYFSAVAGTFNINIDSKEGVFTNAKTTIYLEDKLLNVIHDLKKEPYNFTTEKGTFNDRFLLRYTNFDLETQNLGTDDFNANENLVLVSNKNREIKINSFTDRIDKVQVFDLTGRQIYQKKEVNSTEFTIANLAVSHQVLLVKTMLQNGKISNKKILF